MVAVWGAVAFAGTVVVWVAGGVKEQPMSIGHLFPRYESAPVVEEYGDHGSEGYGRKRTPSITAMPHDGVSIDISSTA